MTRFVRFRSIRARTTIAASAIVLLCLLIVAITTILILQRSLENNILSTARLKAADIVASLDTQSPEEIAIPQDDDTVVHLTDDDGVVLASNAPVEARSDLPTLAADEDGTFHIPSIDDDPFIFVAATAEGEDITTHVLVGKNSDLAVEATATSIRIAVIAFPVLLLLVSMIIWKLTGRALAPVERLRREVDSIQHSVGARLEVPDTSDEISRLATTMNRLLTRLEEAQERRQRFVSDASHELRNPIASIRQHAEVALAHPDSTDVTQLARDVLSEDLRLQRIAEDLLLLARADEDALDVELEPVDLDDLVFEEADRLRRTGSFEIEIGSVSPARISGHRPSLQRAIRNVGDNAARHAHQKVSFSLTSDDGTAVLRVDDDGPGIPPEARGEVFERFTRLDEARDREHGGVGLGLAIVAEVVALHDGSATAGESRFGGARIELTFPLHS